MAPASRHIEAKLGGVLSLLLVVCLNPWLTARLLTADGQLESERLTLLLGALAFGLGLVGVLLLTSVWRPKPALAKVIILCGSGLLTFYLTVFIDRLTGKLLLPPAQSLLFPANSEVNYKTAEFQITARINHLGFRDYEYPLQKGKKYRILVIGDSFTFGWGVNIEDTWVKLLEAKLQSENPEVEVLNLGRSGGSPENYAAIAKQVIPVLKPDLVIIALLQGNDLSQLLPVNKPGTDLPPPPQLAFRRIAGIAIANAYPNFSRLLATTTLQTEVKPVWQNQAAHILRYLSPEEKVKFQQLHPTTKQHFQNGDLNPDLIYELLKDPDQYLRLEDTGSQAVQTAVYKLQSYLKQIQNTAQHHHSQLLAVSVPNKFYLCEKAMQEHTLLGAHIDTRLLRRNTPDSLVAAVTQTLDIPFYTVTSAMRQHGATQRLYYIYDSHFTPLGNALFADAIFKRLRKPVLTFASNRKAATTH